MENSDRRGESIAILMKFWRCPSSFQRTWKKRGKQSLKYNWDAFHTRSQISTEIRKSNWVKKNPLYPPEYDNSSRSATTIAMTKNRDIGVKKKKKRNNNEARFTAAQTNLKRM